MQQSSEISVFIGRFHPLLVHLPIGFLCFALVLHIIQWRRTTIRFTNVLPVIWLSAALSGGLSVLTGWLLSDSGDYDSDTLQLHKYGGIAVSVFSLLVFLTYWKRAGNINLAPFRFIGIAGAIMAMLFTGHWGGSLTHGAAYLTEYSPFGKTDNDLMATGNRAPVRDLDSAYLFEDAVMPILQAKCSSCHNAEKKKGEYLLTSYEEIIKGGKTGAGVVPGNLAMSELYRRISLPEDHREFMPTDGKTPLTEEQRSIIEWWIETGAHQRQRITAFSPNSKRKDELTRFFRLDQLAVQGYNAPAPSPKAVEALLKAGYLVNLVKKEGNLLEVKYNGKGNSKPDLSLLAPLSDQLVWLHLENCLLDDPALAALAGLKNLYKLNLNRNPISENGLGFLTGFDKLEYLNLYGTQVTEAALPLFAGLPSLKKLYLWESRVDPRKIDTSLLRPNLQVVLTLENSNPGESEK